MIKSIHLQNFFGFQDCTINLEKGENVLVGINGSGKSNFLKALKLFSEIRSHGKGIEKTIGEDFFGMKRLVNSGTSTRRSPYLTFKLDVIDMFEDEDYGLYYVMGFVPSSDENDYSLIEKVWNVDKGVGDVSNAVFTRNGSNIHFIEDALRAKNDNQHNSRESCVLRFQDEYIDLSEVAQVAESIRVYDYFDTTIKSDIRRGSSYRTENYLLNGGANLAPVLQWLANNKRTEFKIIEQTLKTVNGAFEMLSFYSTPSSIAIQISEDNLETSTHASQISDGTLRFLCLMAIFYNPNRGSVICIDEPELGLHPDMIRTVAEAIKYAAQTSQVIISTHSTELLNHFDLENIRVFEKDENNATIVNQFNSETFKDWFDEYTVGQLWRQGHLGGNRW